MNLDQALDYARAVGLTDRQIAAVVRQEADRVRFKQDNGDVTMTHPDLDAEITVHPDAVAQHELAGWVTDPAAQVKWAIDLAAPASSEPPTDETPDETPAARKPRKATT